jgi:hypothetical protein
MLRDLLRLVNTAKDAMTMTEQTTRDRARDVMAGVIDAPTWGAFKALNEGPKVILAALDAAGIGLVDANPEHWRTDPGDGKPACPVCGIGQQPRMT